MGVYFSLQQQNLKKLKPLKKYCSICTVLESLKMNKSILTGQHNTTSTSLAIISFIFFVKLHLVVTLVCNGNKTGKLKSQKHQSFYLMIISIASLATTVSRTLLFEGKLLITPLSFFGSWDSKFCYAVT